MKLFVSHKPQPARPAPGSPAVVAKPVPREKLRAAAEQKAAEAAGGKVPELGGPSGPEPTRYGDWERNGICSDF